MAKQERTVLVTAPVASLRSLVQSDIAVHGYRFAAQARRRRIPFSIFYWLAFGRAPRRTVTPSPARRSFA